MQLPDISKYFRNAQKPTTLFEPTKQDLVTALLQKRCALCGKKLYQNRKGDKWFCKSKVSNDKFMILDSTLKKYW